MFEEKREAVIAIEAEVLPLTRELAAREPARLAYRDICSVGNRRHESFDIIAFRALESQRIETRCFRLDNPQ
jgi:hypothetical protein